MGKPKKGKRLPKPKNLASPVPECRALVVHPSPGRPTIYTDYIVQKILIGLAAGTSLRRLCSQDDELPAESTVRAWALNDLNGFYARYARARDLGLDSMTDETLDIADDGRNDTTTLEDGTVVVDWDHIARSKLRIDTRKWYISKIAANLKRPEGSPEGSVEGDYIVLKPDEPGPDAPIV